MSSIPFDFERSLLADRKWRANEIQVNEEIARTISEKSRKCTDVLCCLIFLIFNVGMVAAATYGFENGQPGRLIAPIDSDGKMCGFSNGYENFPKLYIDDIVRAAANPTKIFLYSVCVEKCPRRATDVIHCKPTARNTDCNSLVINERYGTLDLANYCYPDYETLPLAAKMHWDTMAIQVEDSGAGGAVIDVFRCRWLILLSSAFALIITLIYIKFVDWCAFCFSWLQVLLILGTFIGVGTWTFLWRDYMIQEDPMFINEPKSTQLLLIAIGMWVVGGIYFMLMCCNLKKLRIAVAVVETAAEYFADTKRIILVPVLYFMLGVTFFVAWAFAIICVASIGDIEVLSIQNQTKNIDWDAQTTVTVIYMIFGFLWVSAYLVACNEFVIVVSAVSWYYSDKTITDDDGIPGDADVRFGFWWSIRYHMGSIALGSCLMSTTAPLRAIFEYMGNKMHGVAPAGSCGRAIVSCCNCYIACHDRFLRFLNRNAYIYMALSSEPFCSSSLNSFILLLKNKSKFAFVDGIADMFMFLAKFFISTSTTCLSFAIMGWMTQVWTISNSQHNDEGNLKDNQRDRDTEVKYAFLPLAVIFLLAWMISSVFIAVFDISANTILQCYLLDKEIAFQQDLPDPDHVPPAMTKFFKNPDVVEERRNSEIEQVRRQRPGRPGQTTDDSADNLIEIHETRHR